MCENCKFRHGNVPVAIPQTSSNSHAILKNMTDSTKSISFTEFLDYMIDKNHAGHAAVKALLAASPSKGNEALLRLEELGIIGANIWYCFDDICDRRTDILFKKVADGSIADELEKIPFAHYKKPKN